MSASAIQRAGSGLSGFVALFMADLVVRTAYQIGKAPVLPVLAYNLGAETLFLGLIVAVSTITGLVLKPTVGFLSDRSGRLTWLLIGTALFAFVPFLYLWVTTPRELFSLRLVHGLATAIYGPVTLAYVAHLRQNKAAESYGWFDLARTGAHIIGPAVGGLLLNLYRPEHIYVATGLFAMSAFIPVMYLRQLEPLPMPSTSVRRPIFRALRTSFGTLSNNRPLLVLAVIEANTYIGLYAVKAFLPIVILSTGENLIKAGIFLSIQEAANVLARPVAGRMADRSEPARLLIFGLCLMAFGLFMLPLFISSDYLLAVAVVLGIGQAAFGPAALAMVAYAAPKSELGLAFGTVGALRNCGKIAGPVVAGGMAIWCPLNVVFAILAIVPLAVAVYLMKSRWSQTAKPTPVMGSRATKQL